LPGIDGAWQVVVAIAQHAEAARRAIHLAGLGAPVPKPVLGAFERETPTYALGDFAEQRVAVLVRQAERETEQFTRTRSHRPQEAAAAAALGLHLQFHHLVGGLPQARAGRAQRRFQGGGEGRRQQRLGPFVAGEGAAVGIEQPQGPTRRMMQETDGKALFHRRP
jgi:hypothetical protein